MPSKYELAQRAHQAAIKPMTKREERARHHNARYMIIRDIASILANMERLGSTEMGNLKFQEAMKFHKATDLLRALVDKAMGGVRNDQG
jgi:hypothetical protein